MVNNRSIAHFLKQIYQTLNAHKTWYIDNDKFLMKLFYKIKIMKIFHYVFSMSFSLVFGYMEYFSDKVLHVTF